MADIDRQIGMVHNKFIDAVVEGLHQKGINCGRTEYTPFIDHLGDVVYAAIVIARTKEGWKSHLPGGFKYNTSEEGILMRVYGALKGATTDASVREVVGKEAPDYVKELKALVEPVGWELVRDEYHLGSDLRHGENIRREMTFR